MRWNLLGLEEAIGEAEEDDGVDEKTGLGGDAAVLDLDFEHGPSQVIIDEFKGTWVSDNNEEESGEEGSLDIFEVH